MNRFTSRLLWTVALVGIAVFTQSQYTNNALATVTFPEPISFYEFDQTTGDTDLIDSIRGNSGKGILVGSPTFDSGRVGNALCFNGTTQYATAPILSGVASEFTISAWAKLDTASSWATIVKNWGDANVGTFHFGLNAAGSRWSNFLGLVTNGALSVEDTGTAQTGQWLHLITTASQSQGKMRLYVNNAMVHEVSFSGTITTFGNLMSFGAKLNDSQTGIAPVNPGWLDGCLDEVAFWDSALSPSQIGDIYSSGLSGTSPIAPPPQATPTTVQETTTTAAATTTIAPTTTVSGALVDTTTTSLVKVQATAALPRAGGTEDNLALVAFAILMVGIVLRRTSGTSFSE